MVQYGETLSKYKSERLLSLVGGRYITSWCIRWKFFLLYLTVARHEFTILITSPHFSRLLEEEERTFITNSHHLIRFLYLPYIFYSSHRSYTSYLHRSYTSETSHTSLLMASVIFDSVSFPVRQSFPPSFRVNARIDWPIKMLPNRLPTTSDAIPV